MGKFYLAAASVALFVYAVFDLIATPRRDIRGPLPKPLWFVVLLVPGVGPLTWLIYGHRRAGRPGTGGPRRPGPRPPHGPDDDPDYLRGL